MKYSYRLAPTLLLIAAVLSLSTETRAQVPEASAESRVFELPLDIRDGDAKEIAVLLDESYLKLATIILRDGTALPPHSTPVAATIQVLEGEGVIHIGSGAVKVAKGSIVSLAAGEEHDVVPTPGSDMLLLVHYLRCDSAAASQPTSGHDH